MKLHKSILQRLIDLPTQDRHELHALLDDLGLEVKGIEQIGAEVIFNIETLANRGDHLHALGVAREISARSLSTLNYPAVCAELPQNKSAFPMRVLTDKCLRYALLDMTIAANMRLQPEIAAVMGEGAADKPAIVNYLNYIQLELGQPMHAFDRDKVEGEVRITLSKDKKEVQALDGKTYAVPAGSILIEDSKKVIAVAGVIGLANSMVSKATTRVLIESATFDPISVRKTARAMGISTDASYAFERGQDLENVLYALRRLAQLTQGLGGTVKDADGSHVIGLSYAQGEPTAKRKINFRLSDLRREMNLGRLEELEILSRLKHLGYTLELVDQSLKGSDKIYSAQVPSWRLWDVEHWQDIAEDFARAHGLNRVKQILPALDYEQAKPDPVEELTAKIEGIILGNGFLEVISKGFYSAEDARLLSDFEPSLAAQHVTIKNAIERSYSHMKVSNVLHLARLASHNERRGVKSFKVYELGRVFGKTHSKDSPYEFERDVLSLAVSGRWYEHDYRKSETPEQLLALLKGVVEQIVARLGFEVQVQESSNGIFHPGARAALQVGRFSLGTLGLIHPELKRRLDLRSDFAYAELEVDLLAKLKAEVTFSMPVDLPAITRDITLKMPLRAMAAQVLKIVSELKLAILERVFIADHFKKPDENYRRVTYRLVFRDAKRTLQHEEVDRALEQILGDLKSKHQLELA